MAKQGTSIRRRPSYPSARRQAYGIALTAIVVAAIDVAIGLDGRPRDPGGLYFFLVMFVTLWTGPWAGMLSTALILAYLSNASRIPGSAFQHVPFAARHVPGLAIVLPTVVVIIGLVQGRIRRSAMREYDATLAAETEAKGRQHAEELWRLVVDASMDAIVVIRDDGTISLWNENAARIFGWRPEEILGRTLAETIIPPVHRSAHEEGLARFRQTGEGRILGRRLELTALAKDGREFPIELTVVPHESYEGRYFVGFIRDMTETKKLVARLRQAQKMEAVGSLAGGIAHDFNNILAAIAGNTALARADAPSDHAVQESLAEIEKATARATAIVGQILKFSRSKETPSSPIAVEPTLLEAIGLLKATLPANIEIVTRFEPDLPPMLADPAELHQIVLNLAINASYAMKPSGGRLSVEAIDLHLDEETAAELLRVKPGHYVRISVGDTGCGMDPRTLERIFDPFFTTKPVGEGTGLGLSVVYGIVDRYGGAVTVYSEPDKGTVFHLYFPVAEGQAVQVESAVEQILPGEAQRILYVDDDEALVFMMTRMLRRLNYQVEGFENPQEALEAIRSDPTRFDVLITDLSMPLLDGPDLVKQVREIRPDLPIVMVTGYIRPEDLEQAALLDIKDLVLKPNSVQEMSQVLSGILGRKAPVS